MNEEELLSKLVSIDSQTHKSNKEIIEFISSFFLRLGVNPEVKNVNKNKKTFNLILKIPRTKESDMPPLILSGHTDTVMISNEEQLLPEVRNGVLFGRGACDMKAGLTSIMLACKDYLKEKERSKDVYVIFTSDEEGSGEGIIKLCKDFSLNERADIIVAEPTNNNLFIGQKSCLDLELIFNGERMHSSMLQPNNLNKNAILNATSFINKVMELLQSEYQGYDELFGYTSFNVGTILSEGAPNIVPDKCIIKINIRANPNYNIDEIQDKVLRIAERIDPKVKIKILFKGDSFMTSKESRIINKILNSCKCDLKYKWAWTEASYLSKYGDVVIFGPGNPEYAHKNNEQVKISDIEMFRKIYFTLMTK